MNHIHNNDGHRNRNLLFEENGFRTKMLKSNHLDFEKSHIFLKNRIPMKKLLMYRYNREIEVAQYAIKNQKKLNKLKKEGKPLKIRISSQSIKLFFMRKRNLEVDSQRFFKCLKLFKNLRNLSIVLDFSAKSLRIKNTSALKRINRTLNSLTLSSDKNESTSLCKYNKHNMSMTVNANFQWFKKFKHYIWRLYFPKMKEIVIRHFPNESFYQSQSLNSIYFSTLFNHQSQLRSILIDSTNLLIPYNTFKSLLLKYRPYCEILKPNKRNFGRLLQEENGLEFDFYFIQTYSRLIVNMDKNSLKIPHVLIEKVPAGQDDILYAQKYENGRKNIYVYPNAGYVQSGFLSYIAHDNEFFIMNDGVRTAEERLIEVCTNGNNADERIHLKVPEKITSINCWFEKDVDFELDIITRVDWIREKYYLTSQVQSLAFYHLDVGRNKIWNELFCYIKEKNSQLKEVSLSYRLQAEDVELETFFMDAMNTISHLPKSTIELQDFSKVHIINSNECTEIFLEVSSRCKIRPLFQALNQEFKRVKSLFLKIISYQSQVFQEICEEFTNCMFIDKLNLTISWSSNVQPADLLILSEKLGNSTKVKYLNLELNYPNVRSLKNSIETLHNKMAYNKTNCTLVTLWLKNINEKDKDLQKLDKIQFSMINFY